MGSSSSVGLQGQNLQNNEWIKYELELQKDQISDVPPFYRKELLCLEQLFNVLDKKNLKSLELKDFDEVSTLRDHPLYPRIKELFEDQMKKIKAKRINFELFLYLLSTFHIKTNVETKVKFLFRLYDCDKNLKIDSSDLMKIYKLIYQFPFFQEEDYSKLVTETLIRFGTKGEIKMQSLMEALNQDEVMEIMSFKFNSRFV